MSRFSELFGLDRRRIRVGVRRALGGIFIATGVLKLSHPVQFHASLLAYDIAAPDWFFRLIAVALPWLEALSGGLFLANVWTETAGVVVASLCLVFVFALSEAVGRGLHLDCACFGAVDVGWFDRPTVALARALMLLGGSVWLLLQPACGPERAASPVDPSRSEGVSLQKDARELSRASN